MKLFQNVQTKEFTIKQADIDTGVVSWEYDLSKRYIPRKATRHEIGNHARWINTLTKGKRVLLADLVEYMKPLPKPTTQEEKRDVIHFALTCYWLEYNFLDPTIKPTLEDYYTHLNVKMFDDDWFTEKPTTPYEEVDLYTYQQKAYGDMFDNGVFG